MPDNMDLDLDPNTSDSIVPRSLSHPYCIITPYWIERSIDLISG